LRGCINTIWIFAEKGLKTGKRIRGDKEMEFTKEMVTYMVGLVIIVSAVVLVGLEKITFDNMILMVSIALSIMGFGSLTPRGTEAKINALLYKFRDYQPMFWFEGNKLVLSIADDMDTEPVKLINKFSKIYGLPVELRKHSRVTLLSGQPDIKAGDAIKPTGKYWEGSLGYSFQQSYYTNAHVLPEEGLTVQHVRTGKVFGVTEWVSKIRTFSRGRYFLSFFGFKLPTNKVDAARIKLLYGMEFKPFNSDLITSVAEGDKIVAFGRTSGYREGEVKNTNVKIILEWPHNGKLAVFEDIIMASLPARPGDSGGPVYLKDTLNIVGLVFAGPQDGSFALIIKASNIHEAEQRT
jgi:hypothetical protein